VEEIVGEKISSPSSEEELIFPLAIDKKYTLTPNKKHKRPKTHITHRVYKKPKSKVKTRSRSKSTSSRRKTMSIIDLL